jgi:WD40 repeat protein
MVFILPDGKTFLSLAPEEENMVVCVWQMSTGKLLRRFETASPSTEAVALSPDGKILAFPVYDRPRAASRISLWDVDSGRRKGEWAAIGGSVRALAFAPDGKTIATAHADQTLRLWDRDTATELRRCQGVRDQWLSLVFSPDGKVLASASGTQRSVQLWDAATGRALHTLGDGKGRTSAVAFSPDGKTLAAGAYGDKSVRLWDTSTGKEIHQLPVDWRTETVAFSPDGKTVAAGGLLTNGQLSSISPIRLWDVSSGREVRRFSGHVFKVSSLAFSPRGDKLISAGSFFTLHVWDVATGKDCVPLVEHESYVESVAFSPDGRSLATGSLDGTIRLWEPAAGKPARRFQGETQPSILQVAFAPDGRTLASAEHDGSLRLWDVATGRQVRKIQVGEDRYSPSFAYSPDGRTLAVWHQDGTVRLLDADTVKERRRLSGAARYGTFLCFSPDGGTLASMSTSYGPTNGVLQLWDTATGTEKRQWKTAQPGSFFRAVFSLDGGTVIGSINHFSSADGERKRFFSLHQWDVATGDHRSFATPEQATVFCLALSPDGRTLAWGDSEGTITLWERAAHQVRRRLKGQYSSVRSLAFSPDGKTLASGSADTTVLLWDVTGRPATTSQGDLSAARLHALWDDLANEDPGKAFDAIGLLTAAREKAVPLLKAKVRPAPDAADKQQVACLLADLDSEEFAARQKAKSALQQLGEGAEPGLRHALAGKLTLETRKRIEELLEGVRVSLASPENLRTLRAVEVLEHLGTAEARAVLKTLADGAPASRLTREARAAQTRLKSRAAP